VPGDGVITGFARVNGRLIYLSSQDFTVLGGSVGEMHGKKIAHAMNMAVQNGAPFISINDSGGARIQEGITSLCAYGDVFFANTKASGVIPQISLIMGPCAGGAVYSPGITDFTIMVENTSNMFITGPEVIRAVTNEDVTMDDLGGPEVHATRSGVCCKICPDDEGALDWVKKLLGYLPSNNLEPAPQVKLPDFEPEHPEELKTLVPSNPNKPYDIYDAIRGIIDRGTFLETNEYFAKNIITGFARLNGKSVGIVANKPKELAGCIDVDASDKAARFVRFCDAFNIPLVTLVDVPGFLPGVDQEHTGIIRHGAKLLYAYSEATVPKLTVILRKAYGGAYICMCSKHLGADTVLAWPGAEIAVMGPQGAVNIVFKKEIQNSEDPTSKLQEYIQLYTEKSANPQMAASLGYVDDIIDPSETRTSLIRHLEPLLSKRVEVPKRKHGNIPL
ncbi:MAG: acyl-CoA carboxylase subunit beta, partial [SAR324 cluster bacterium]|nr:acyl-CoA carboxylase subunit beta [SAR324 cluster bacterium]